MNTSEFYKTTLNFVDTTTKILKIASEIAQKQADTEASVAVKAAETAALLKSAELIDAHEIKRAESQLKDPAQALAVISNIVDHYKTQLKEANAKLAGATLGVPDGPSSVASAKSVKNANYIGRRRGNSDGPTEADAALLRLLPGNSR